MSLCRNEAFQEQMWKKTFEFLKDHLSPDAYEKYGPKPEEEPTQSATEGKGDPPQSATEGKGDPPLSATEG